MKYFEVPVIAGTTEQQIEQIKNYLYLQHEALNYNLEQGTAEKVFEQAQQAMANAANPIESEQVRDSYRAFRDLIVGTAEEAFKVGDSFQRVLRQIEGYRSAFGTFTEEITRTIGTAPSGTTDIYSYIGTVKTTAENAGTAAGNAATAAAAAQGTANGAASYITNQQNFIKSGYLDTTANPPVFGIEIGMLESSYTEELDGQSTTIQATPEKIRITPGRIGFWTGSGNSETEAAYITNGAVYFPAAHITGGSISIGNGAFSVTSGGVLSATGATIGGTITAASGSTFGGWKIGSDAIYRGAETFGGSNTLYFGSNGLSIKDRFQVDSNGNLKMGMQSTLGSYPFEVSAAGAVTCTSATIGGWTVDADGLSRNYNTIQALIGVSGISFGNYEGTAATTYYAGIDTTGVLRARGAIISGTVYAGAGEIGGWTIASDCIKKLDSNSRGIELIPGSNPCIKITEADKSFTGLATVTALFTYPSVWAKDNAREAVFGKYGFAFRGNNVIAHLGSQGLITTGGAYIEGGAIIAGGATFGGSSNTVEVVGKFKCGSFYDCGNNYIKLGGYILQWGKVNASLSSGAASGNESFPTRFSNTPAMACVYNGSEPDKYMVKCDPDTYRFSWAIVPNGGTWSGTVGFTWIAIGKA